MGARVNTLVITGASKGIGLATARLFLDHGYRVINFSRSTPPDDRINSFEVDLSYDDAADKVSAIIGEQVESGSKIILVHNAAKLINDSAKDAATDSFREILNLNVVAPHVLNQATIPHMGPGSAILYIGSTLSEKAVANTYSYVTSKHAMVGMMRATCQDFAGSGIHTCCICPGFTNTEMLRAHVGEDTEILQAIGSNSTFGRLIEPTEIAATIAFAAENPVINGAVIHANLGQVES